jgi:hypothetical protein
MQINNLPNIGDILIAKVSKKQYVFLGEVSDTDYEKFGINRPNVFSYLQNEKDYMLMQAEGKEFFFQTFSQICLYFQK